MVKKVLFFWWQLWVQFRGLVVTSSHILYFSGRANNLVSIQVMKNSLTSEKEMRIICPCWLNKVFCSKFEVGYRVRQTPAVHRGWSIKNMTIEMEIKKYNALVIRMQSILAFPKLIFLLAVNCHEFFGKIAKWFTVAFSLVLDSDFSFT